MKNKIHDLYLIAFGQIMQQNKQLSFEDIYKICDNNIFRARDVEQMIHESRFIQYKDGKHSKKMDFDFSVHGLI